MHREILFINFWFRRILCFFLLFLLVKRNNNSLTICGAQWRSSNVQLFPRIHKSRTIWKKTMKKQRKTLKKLVIWSISNLLYVCRRSSFSFRLIYCFGAVTSDDFLFALCTSRCFNVIFSLNLLRSVPVFSLCVCQYEGEREKKNLLAPYIRYEYIIFLKSLMKMILIEANLPIIISEHVAVRSFACSLVSSLFGFVATTEPVTEYQKTFSPTAQLITIMNNFFSTSSATKCLRGIFFEL